MWVDALLIAIAEGNGVAFVNVARRGGSFYLSVVIAEYESLLSGFDEPALSNFQMSVG
ncbi:hypothetical protein ABLO27_20055 [Roseibium sp. SCPC15]|uniref:hypothetical protein n=1 Tax=Roseibium sp. SCP15 TaxID=3141376 RepID=UPI00333D1B04